MSYDRVLLVMPLIWCTICLYCVLWHSFIYSVSNVLRYNNIQYKHHCLLVNSGFISYHYNYNASKHDWCAVAGDKENNEESASSASLPACYTFSSCPDTHARKSQAADNEMCIFLFLLLLFLFISLKQYLQAFICWQSVATTMILTVPAIVMTELRHWRIPRHIDH